VSRKFLPLSIPNLGEKEIEYVTNAVKTGWIPLPGPMWLNLNQSFQSM